MKIKVLFSLMLLMISLFLCLPHTAAEYEPHTQWGLPEGAIARLGKGWITGDTTFLPDSARLAVTSSIGIWIYDVQTGEELNLLTGHTGSVHGVSLSPDGQTLTSGSEDNTVRLWDVQTSEHLHTRKGHTNDVSSVAFGPDGNTLASSSGEKTVRLWDIQTGEHLHILKGHTESVISVVFSPDSNTLASGSTDGIVLLWDITPIAQDISQTSLHAAINVEGTLRDIAYSPDGARLAVASTFGIWIYDTDTSTEATLLKEDPNYPIRNVLCVAFSPDGNTLASGIVKTWESGTVHLSDSRTGELKQGWYGEDDSVFSIAFSPDGNTLASAAHPFDYSDEPPTNNTIRLSDTHTGEYLQTLEGHTDWINSVVYSPDGNTLASGSDDNTVRLWDANTGELVQTLGEHRDAVNSVVYSPDGNTLASGSDDNTVRLWDAMTSKYIKILKRHTGGVNSVNFSPDGRLLASGSEDGTILLWEITPPAPPPLPEDVNEDGAVNIQDLVLVASRFGETGENAADVNGDGVVNIQDLVLVAGAFGKGAAAAPTAHNLSGLTPETVQQWLTAAEQMHLTDAVSLRGIAVLEHLLATLIPKETALLANYPNPFNPETWIPYQLAEPADVTLTIYAVDGQVIRTLALGHQPAGIYQSRARAAYWDGRNQLGEPIASGVYFYTLTAGEFTATRKLLIRK